MQGQLWSKAQSLLLWHQRVHLHQCERRGEPVQFQCSFWYEICFCGKSSSDVSKIMKHLLFIWSFALLPSQVVAYTDSCRHHLCTVLFFTLPSGMFHTCAVDQHLLIVAQWPHSHNTLVRKCPYRGDTYTFSWNVHLHYTIILMTYKMVKQMIKHPSWRVISWCIAWKQTIQRTLCILPFNLAHSWLSDDEQ